MLSSIRYIAIVCLLLVLVGAVAFGSYFRQLKSFELIETTLAEHQAVIATYTDTVWQDFSTPKSAIHQATPADFIRSSTRFFANFGWAKIAITSPDRTRSYFSSSALAIAGDSSRESTDSRISGRAHAQIVEAAPLAHATAAPVLIQSVIPIFPPTISGQARTACLNGTSPTPCTPLAMAEIHTDITPRWEAMRFQQQLFTGLIICSFVLLGGGLLITTKRAESIIAKQHELNLELTAAAARAEAQIRDKSQFLASVSHELRTPLNAIIGFSEIVKNEAKGQLQKVYYDYVEDIYASGKHLLSLINDILDYSKAEAGKLQIEWAETDVTKVIRNSLRMVMPRAENAQITLVEDVPTHHIVITTDAKKLKQVLLNLLSNAVKFTPPGGEVRCQVWEDVMKQGIVIQVRDTGIGIAPKDLSRVMTPFGQVDSALSRKYEGTGLGLPLAKAFLESMGGEFGIDSELNTGTVVTLTIPKAPRHIVPDTQLPPTVKDASHGAAAPATQPA
jgi:signal transduction histidine kinase